MADLAMLMKKNGLGSPDEEDSESEAGGEMPSMDSDSMSADDANSSSDVGMEIASDVIEAISSGDKQGAAKFLLELIERLSPQGA